MKELIQSPFLGLLLCIGAFEIGLWLNRKLKSPIVNPLLVAIVCVIVFLKVTKIPLKNFETGGGLINMFLAPATCVLAVSVYRQIKVLKKYFIPILCGCLAGSAVSMTSAYLLCKAFRLDDSIAKALIPKSVTTPIAMAVSESLGGVVPITVAVVIITGVIGCVAAPILIRVFRVKSPVAAGVAIGVSSHALGTTKAVEIGEVEGAMSGIAIGVSGILTVIISLFLV